MAKTNVPYLDTRGKRQVKRVKTYERTKKNGHTHDLYEARNTRGDVLECCMICKYHKIKYVVL